MDDEDPGKQIVDSEIATRYGDLPVVVKDYIVVAEIVGDEGCSLLVSTGNNTAPWTIYGLLEYAEQFFRSRFASSDFGPDACGS